MDRASHCRNAGLPGRGAPAPEWRHALFSHHSTGLNKKWRTRAPVPDPPPSTPGLSPGTRVRQSFKSRNTRWRTTAPATSTTFRTDRPSDGCRAGPAPSTPRRPGVSCMVAIRVYDIARPNLMALADAALTALTARGEITDSEAVLIQRGVCRPLISKEIRIC
ncbi:hypothetical protein EIQ01_15285 [Xanthomonas campestris pv. raphani]